MMSVYSSGLILSACVSKHTDAFIEQLVINTQGKTRCKQVNTDDWGGYERVLPPEIKHYIGKDKTQRLERTALKECFPPKGTGQESAPMELCGNKPEDV